MAREKIVLLGHRTLTLSLLAPKAEYPFCEGGDLLGKQISVVSRTSGLGVPLKVSTTKLPPRLFGVSAPQFRLTVHYFGPGGIRTVLQNQPIGPNYNLHSQYKAIHTSDVNKCPYNTSFNWL